MQQPRGRLDIATRVHLYHSSKSELSAGLDRPSLQPPKHQPLAYHSMADLSDSQIQDGEQSMT